MNSEPNLLDLVPVKIAGETGRKNGHVQIYFPRFKSKAGTLFGMLFRSSRTIKVNLDEKSTALWDLIDGRKNVGQIGREMMKIFGDEIDPVYERLSALLRIMEKNKMISMGHDPGGEPVVPK